MKPIPPDTLDILKKLEHIDAGQDPDLIPTKPSDVHDYSAAAKGLHSISHIISGIFVGLVFGYGLDMMLNSSPWGIVILTPIGFLGGFVNMVRMLNAQDKEQNDTHINN